MEEEVGARSKRVVKRPAWAEESEDDGFEEEGGAEAQAEAEVDNFSEEDDFEDDVVIVKKKQKKSSFKEKGKAKKANSGENRADSGLESTLSSSKKKAVLLDGNAAPSVDGASSAADFSTLSVPPSSSLKTPAGLEGVVWNYMRSTNRPYSVINIADNLKKSHNIPRAMVQSICDKLVTKGDLRVKIYGKGAAYFFNQAILEESMGDVSDAQIASLEAAEAKRKVELTKVAQRRREVETSAADLQAEPTDEELDSLLVTLTRENEEEQARLLALESAQGGLVSPEALAKAKAEFNRVRKIWVDRKRSVTDFVDQVCEGMEKKSSVVMDMLGIESDGNTAVPPRM